jgi:polygalacturonase
MKYLSKTFALALCITYSVSSMAQVISFSMEAEKNSKNTPEGWNEVQLPKDLPSFTETNTFYITSYGASTESADNTKAIQDALNAANSAGGGMVVIPSGEWLSNTIQIGSKTILHLCAGATLRWLAYGDRSITDGNNFIIHKGTPTDVVIEGEGNTSIIDGQGAPWWEHYKDSGVKRGAMIRFGNGNRFLFRNFRMQNAPGANLTVGQSGRGAHTTIHDIEIKNPSSEASTPSHNTDGIPIWTQYVNIYNCMIDTGDDNVVTDSEAQYVHVWNCTFKDGHGASFGSYTTNMHHIIYEGITFDGTGCGFRLKSNRDRSGDVHDIIFRNCTMNNVEAPISMTAWYDNTPDLTSTAQPKIATTPEFHNILIQNVTASGYIDGKNSNDKKYNGIQIAGRPESYVYDVTFDNVQISHRNGVRLFFCKDIKFINGCTFTRTKDNKTVKATDADLSAVMEHEHEASYSWNKETSGIEKIVASKNTSKETSYSLQGVQITNPTKGLYIKNGKKVVIK